MNTMSKLRVLAEANGWKFVEDGDVFSIYRLTPEAGYPSGMFGRVDGRKVVGGKVINDGDTFPVGIRHMTSVLENVNNPLRYKIFLEAFEASEPNEKSEKAIAAATGYSERQIRNARILGFVDPYLLDALCWRLLDRHPATLYGMDAWIDGVDLEDDSE